MYKFCFFVFFSNLNFFYESLRLGPTPLGAPYSEEMDAAEAAASELRPADADGVNNGLSPLKVGSGEEVEMGESEAPGGGPIDVGGIGPAADDAGYSR